MIRLRVRAAGRGQTPTGRTSWTHRPTRSIPFRQRTAPDRRAGRRTPRKTLHTAAKWTGWEVLPSRPDPSRPPVNAASAPGGRASFSTEGREAALSPRRRSCSSVPASRARASPGFASSRRRNIRGRPHPRPTVRPRSRAACHPPPRRRARSEHPPRSCPPPSDRFPPGRSAGDAPRVAQTADRDRQAQPPVVKQPHAAARRQRCVPGGRPHLHRCVALLDLEQHHSLCGLITPVTTVIGDLCYIGAL